MAIKKLDIQQQQLELQIRTLELKEKELNARMDNPEAFVQSIILNDSDQVAEWYRKNGTDKPYSQN